MTEPTEHTVPPGLADLPLAVRQARDAAILREQQEGIARRHDAVCARERAEAAALTERFLSIAPAVAAKLNGD